MALVSTCENNFERLEAGENLSYMQVHAPPLRGLVQARAPDPYWLRLY